MEGTKTQLLIAMVEPKTGELVGTNVKNSSNLSSGASLNISRA